MGKRKFRIYSVVMAFVCAMTLVFSLSACDDYVKEDTSNKGTDNWVYVYNWNTFTSSGIQNMIDITYSEEAEVVCTADSGKLIEYGNYDNTGKSVTCVLSSKNKWSVAPYWRCGDPENPETTKLTYVDLILKVDGNIVGYAVVEIRLTKESYKHWVEDLHRSNWYGAHEAKVIKSVLFPKVEGVYQSISESYVESQIKSVKKGN